MKMHIFNHSAGNFWYSAPLASDLHGHFMVCAQSPRKLEEICKMLTRGKEPPKITEVIVIDKIDFDKQFSIGEKDDE